MVSSSSSPSSTTLITLPLLLSLFIALSSPSQSHALVLHDSRSASDHGGVILSTAEDNAVQNINTINIPLQRIRTTTSANQLANTDYTTNNKGQRRSITGSKSKSRRSHGHLSDNIINISKSTFNIKKLDESTRNSNSTGGDDLLKTRIADLTSFKFIKDRISAKWSSKDKTIDLSSSSPAAASSFSNEPIKRANKRPNGPILIKELQSGQQARKRQETQEEDNDAITAAADAQEAQPTLATSRSGAGNPKIPVKTPLIDDVVAREDIEYMAQVNIGTPPQSFNLIVDTGSSDTWVQTSSQGCNNCSNSPTFNPANSSSGMDLGRDFSIYYGIGSTSGDVHSETMSLAGLTVWNQSFAIADHMSSDWTNQPASGILGLGFQTNSKIGDRPLFQTLVEQRSVSKAVFSTAFGRASEGKEDQSSLTLGGVDTTKYQGEITYIPVSTTRWYWQLQFDSINVAGKSAVTPQNNYIKEAIIDTGSTLIAGPKDDVEKFWTNVEGATYDAAGGYWAYPCSSQVNASITFSGIEQPLQISNDDLNFGQVNALSEMCVGAVIEGNTSGYWILGLAFLKNYYTIFDAGNYQIGFAKPTYQA